MLPQSNGISSRCGLGSNGLLESGASNGHLFLFHHKCRKEGRGRNAYDVLNAQAATIPAGSGALIVLPYFMGERSQIWDSDAKGTIVGLSLPHTKAHIYRAFLEAVAFSLRDALAKR